MKIRVILLFCVIFNADTFAQKLPRLSFLKEKNKTSTIANVDSLKLMVDSLQRELIHYDSIFVVNNNLIDSVRRKAREDSFRVAIIVNHLRDSFLNIISFKEKEIMELKANSGFVDTCMVRLANRWLYERFDKADVDKAIKYFDRIYSSKLKEEMSIVQELLRNYESSYHEFQSIMREAQSDIDRESPFACDQYRDKYRRKIEDMMYYRKYYKGDWNIRYLNEQLDKAVQIINNHKNGKFADFSSLIDFNF